MDDLTVGGKRLKGFVRMTITPRAEVVDPKSFDFPREISGSITFGSVRLEDTPTAEPTGDVVDVDGHLVAKGGE